VPTLEQQVAALPAALRARLDARGFDASRLGAWATGVGKDVDAKNRIGGSVAPPEPSDIADLPPEGSPERARLHDLGARALASGEVALCVLAGGMATRMGGVVKALVDALPGKTFLDLRLGENEKLAELAGRPVPLWLMTSEATDAKLRAALGPHLDGEHVSTFEQFVSLRLTPAGDLFRDADGEPSVYATGHGDLPDALAKSGLLAKFRARETAGKKVVVIANIDNLGATVDPVVVGFHLAHGAPLTVELVDKVGGDKGGGPVRWNGRPVVVEEFRLPLGFDPKTVPVFNTNTFLVDADALAKLDLAWTYVEVLKKSDGADAVQYERLLGEITTGLPGRMLRVPRAGVASRFLPVKDMDELERRRPEIDAIARARGLVRA
jgi:UTP--glucose-1-phosphate uridylyltransferase